MIEHGYDHLAQWLIALGLLALVVEVAVLGLSSFILVFLGLSLTLSGGLMMLGLLPETLTTAVWSNALLSGIAALILWKPLKQLQENRQTETVRGDFAQESFILEMDVDISGKSERKYSGISWKLKSQTPIAAGTEVRVTKLEVGTLWVEEKQPKA